MDGNRSPGNMQANPTVADLPLVSNGVSTVKSKARRALHKESGSGSASVESEPPSMLAVGGSLAVGAGIIAVPSALRIAAEVSVSALLGRTASPRASLTDLAAARWLCVNYLGWDVDRARLFDFQRFLPPLPLPNPRETVKRWLRTVQPVVAPEEHAELVELSKRFLGGSAAGPSAATVMHAALCSAREQVLGEEAARIRWGEHPRAESSWMARAGAPDRTGAPTAAGMSKGWSSSISCFYPGGDCSTSLEPALAGRMVRAVAQALGAGSLARFLESKVPRVPSMRGQGNWLRDTWLRFAYLRGRKPLLVHSSFYSTEMCWMGARTRDPAARAAGMAGAALEMMDRIDTQSLPPMLLGGAPTVKGAQTRPQKVTRHTWVLDSRPAGSFSSKPPPKGGFLPVCMDGYRYMFGCFRLPGEKEDIIQVTRPSIVKEPAAKSKQKGTVQEAAAGQTAGRPEESRRLCLVTSPPGCDGTPSRTVKPLLRRLGDLDIVVLRGTAIWVVPVQRGGRRATPEEIHLAVRVACTESPYASRSSGGSSTRAEEALPHRSRHSSRSTGGGSSTSMEAKVEGYGSESGSTVGFSCVGGKPSQWTHPDSPPIALLTTMPRDRWARARRALQQESARNADNLRRIESSAFVISLPDAAPLPEGDPNAHVRWMLHGNGHSLWSDAVFNFVVFRNGRGGTSIEHTPADAPIPSHVVEHVVVHEGRHAPAGTYDPEWASRENEGFFSIAKARFGEQLAHKMFSRQLTGGKASAQGDRSGDGTASAASASAEKHQDESQSTLPEDGAAVDGSFRPLTEPELVAAKRSLGPFAPFRLKWDGFKPAKSATGAGGSDMASSGTIALSSRRGSSSGAAAGISADEDTNRGGLLLTVPRAAASFRDLAASVGIRVLTWLRWGKEAVKHRARCSPDALVQMALQVAARRYFGRPVLTYESASTRRFHLGRTDTIRSCSTEAQVFVDAAIARMVATGSSGGVAHAGSQASTGANPAQPDAKGIPSRESLVQLFQAACKRHKVISTEAGLGQGVDRHFMAMQIAAMSGAGAAAGVGPQHPGLALLYSRAAQLPFELSTSQTPLVAENYGLELPACASLGGGFGPTAVPGIGVSYFVLPTTLYFHVSATAPPVGDAGALGRLSASTRGVIETASGSGHHVPQRLAEHFAASVRETLHWMEADLFSPVDLATASSSAAKL